MGKIVVYCQPGAKQTQCVGLHDGKPKIQLKAPPVDGAANKALIGFLAEVFGVPKSAISIELGASGRTKRVEVAGVDDAELNRRLLAAA
ncbi:DUF167 domain-containing protein [Hydrogenophaga pseudoflava]|jgi:uncharacterized protein (TIGR00251 family)|uniref:UPF0235 protein HPF_05760 n=1 Tax=Hydrogenophaga pseudoflava TaxID=47421 RepID=A0A4P6WUV1_HYDPS|nr:DUF167 domain-containing protein [Hydrogenophaga pseudoflava]QBM27180.1 hypothetical protein HPF_05760 [Hydrogenophaga pseudoflava]